MAYAVSQDVYDLGLTAQAFALMPRALDPRRAEYLTPSTGTFRVLGHGFTVDDAVEFVLIGAGAIPGGASLDSTYHPLPLDFWRFRLSLSRGGTPVTFTDTGSGGWALQVDPERRITRACAVVSDEIDQDLIAHATPILPDPVTHAYPGKLVGIVARYVARRLVAGITFENAAFRAATERLQAEEKRDDAQRERWRNGEPLLPTPLDQTATPDDTAKTGTSGVAGPDALATAWLTGAM